MVGDEVPFRETPEAVVKTPLLLFVVLLLEMAGNDDVVLVAEIDLENLFSAVGDRVLVEGLVFSQHPIALVTDEDGYRAT